MRDMSHQNMPVRRKRHLKQRFFLVDNSTIDLSLARKSFALSFFFFAFIQTHKNTHEHTHGYIYICKASIGSAETKSFAVSFLQIKSASNTITAK